MHRHLLPTCSRLLGHTVRAQRNSVIPTVFVSASIPGRSFATSAQRDDEQEEEIEIHRTAKDGRMHVTSLNIQTQRKSLVELSLPKTSSSTRPSRLATMPDSAVVGLRNAIVDTNRPPKQLQHEADQLSARLSQRRFPAPPAVVKALRNKIRLSLRRKQTDEDIGGDDLLTEKMREAREYQLRNEVDKQLKKSHYNWKPLDVESKEGAIAYALARLVPNYAEISRVLDEFSRVDFCPESILDYGSGVGAAFWAANEKFGSKVKEYCLVDTNDQMTQLAMDIMRGNGSSGRALVHPNVNFRRHILPSAKVTYDLVICHRTLIEIGSHETRLQMLTQLWRKTNRYLVLIEDSKEDAFRALMECRDYLLTAGNEIHLEDTISLLQEHECMDEYCERVLRDRDLSEYERWQMIRERLPAGVEPPTNLPPATVYAPCPHDVGCPMLGKDSCSIPVRWRALRADGKKGAKESDGTETGQISYVIMEKGVRKPEQMQKTRILKSRKLSGHCTCDTCTAFQGLQRFTISKRGGELYKKMRGRRDGDLLPLDFKVIATEDEFDLYDKYKL